MVRPGSDLKQSRFVVHPSGRELHWSDDDRVNFESSTTGRFALTAIEAERFARGTPPPPLWAEVWPGPAAAGMGIGDGPTLEQTIPGAPALAEEDAPLDRDAEERELLSAIASGDEAARHAYAEWLEERSEHARAGYLRMEPLVAHLAPSDPRHDVCTRQLRELGQHIDLAWRARVARPPVEGDALPCCPARWDALARTEREDVRRCSTCGTRAYYFATVEEARDAARAGYRVAVDLGAERWEDDLSDAGVRCWCCARRVVSTAHFCPHCGESTRVSQLVTMGDLSLDD